MRFASCTLHVRFMSHAHGENLSTKHYPIVEEKGDIETFGESLK